MGKEANFHMRLKSFFIAVFFLFSSTSLALEVGDKLIIRKPIKTDKNIGVADFLDGKQLSMENKPENKGKIFCRIAVLNGPRGDILKPQELEISEAENDLNGTKDNHFSLKGYSRPLSLFCWKL